jgi:type II secretory pathway pseudopilin PulG
MDERDDAGMTLVELLVSAILFVTVGTLVSLSLDTFLNVSNQVHSSYANTQQILPVSTSIQRLIRTEVEPGPQYVNTLLSGNPLVPLPPFAVVAAIPCTTNGTTTLTSAAHFTAGVYVAGMVISGTNITPGTSVVSVNSTSSITMSQAATGSGTQNLAFSAETTTSATFYANVGVGAVGANAGQPAKVVASLVGTTFTVTDQLANANSCPTTASPLNTCTFGTNPVKLVASITNVVNSTYATPLATAPTPVFTYTILNALGTFQSTVATNAGDSIFASCTGVGDLCPADEVQGVEIDLFIKSPGSKSLTPAEDDTIVYRLSSTSYLYSPTVG